MDDTQVKSFTELFNLIYKGNQHAVEVAHAIIRTLHVWDDLIDKDKPVSDAQINIAFVDAMIVIGGSPLWDSELAAHMKNVYIRWQVANTFEGTAASTDNTLAKSWMLRAGCYDLFVMLAVKLYGLAWGQEIAPLVYDAYGETLSSFLEEMKNA